MLYELDGQPALEIYRTTWVSSPTGSRPPRCCSRSPLRDDCDDDEQLVRTVLAVDEATQSMTFAGDVPEGCLAQLMHANFDRLVDGASDAAGAASEMMADKGRRDRWRSR